VHLTSFSVTTSGLILSIKQDSCNRNYWTNMYSEEFICRTEREPENLSKQVLEINSQVWLATLECKFIELCLWTCWTLCSLLVWRKFGREQHRYTLLRCGIKLKFMWTLGNHCPQLCKVRVNSYVAANVLRLNQVYLLEKLIW